MSATSMASGVARGAMESCGVQPTDIQEAYWGCVIAAGQGQAPDRQATLGAGCNVDTPTTLINKVCASGMKSVMLAAN